MQRMRQTHELYVPVRSFALDEGIGLTLSSCQGLAMASTNFNGRGHADADELVDPKTQALG